MAGKRRPDCQRLNGDGDGEGKKEEEKKPTEMETTTVLDRDGDKVPEGHGQPARHSRKDMVIRVEQQWR